MRRRRKLKERRKGDGPEETRQTTGEGKEKILETTAKE